MMVLAKRPRQITDLDQKVYSNKTPEENQPVWLKFYVCPSSGFHERLLTTTHLAGFIKWRESLYVALRKKNCIILLRYSGDY